MEIVLIYFQTGLPAHPVSPDISPISQRSHNHRSAFQLGPGQVSDDAW